MNLVEMHGLKAASYATTLLCWTCGRSHEVEKKRLLCDCGAPLEQQYDIERMIKDGHAGKQFVARGPGIWRYARLLPGDGAPVTMQEGLTPQAQRRRAQMGLPRSLPVPDWRRFPGPRQRQRPLRRFLQRRVY